MGPNLIPQQFTTDLRRECESMVRELGPATIVLRPPLFMQNLGAPWIRAAITNQRVVPYPVAESVRVSWLSVDDLGAFVSAALCRPDLAGHTLDVGGPEPLDGPSLAHELSRAVGHPLHYAAVSPDALAQQLTEQLGADVAQGIARNYRWFAQRPNTSLLTGSALELASDLRSKPRSVAEWASVELKP